MIGLIAAVVIAAASPVVAAEISVAGFTNGCFWTTTPCTPTSNSASQSAILNTSAGLLFQNAAFSGMTSGETLALDGTPTFPGTAQNTNNLGSLFLGTQPGTYTGSSLTLLTSFSSPGSASFSFIGALSGSGGSGGSVDVDFDNTPVPFVTSGGSFTLQVNDILDLRANGSETAIIGTITVVSTTPGTVPEPASLALLGAGALGMIRVVGRRAGRRR